MTLQPFTIPICLLLAATAHAQLFDRLESLSNRVPVGDPAVTAILSIEGPKAIATADLDKDGIPDFAVSNSDGTVTVLWGDPDPNRRLSDILHLQTGAVSLRGIITADLDGDGFLDIATADPFSGHAFLFFNDGSRSPFEAVPLQTWKGARDLVAEDFDGDGLNDLVIGGINAGLRQYKNTPTEPGSFTELITIPTLDPNRYPDPVPVDYSAKPVFSLRTFHPVDGTAPILVASHAETHQVIVYQANAEGLLNHIQFLTPVNTVAPSSDLHHIELAPVYRPANSGVPDMIGSSKKWNNVVIWKGNPSPPYFDAIPVTQIPIAGAPRATSAADRDGDGWNDLAIVQRNADAALVFTNNRDTTFTQAETVPLGVSPRDIVTPDLNRDGLADIVTTNRKSRDISLILTTDPANPEPSKVTARSYPTDGGPAGLATADINSDGLDDVIQLHRTSGDLSVRLTSRGGALGPPAFYAMGILPSQLTVSDFNNDTLPDFVTANLGRGNTGGSFTIRYNNGDGTLSQPRNIEIPQSPTSVPGDRSTSIFAIVDADFDGDGITDQAVGYYDCRVGLFRGLEDGTYEQLNIHRFVYESRVMVTGDFDQDGDFDLAGAGETGEVVVFENEGDLLTTETPLRRDYNLGENGKSGVKSAVLHDYNNDGDPDFIIGTQQGTFLLFGAEGATFAPVTTPLNGASTTASLAGGDFDNDGDSDLAIACDVDSTLTILTLDSGGNFQPALTNVPVPSAEFIASGDIDGDGLADLVGTGSTLWVALSGPGDTTAPTIGGSARPRLAYPVINEILAVNDNIPIVSDSGKRVDVVELYNGSEAPADLSGWTLRLEVPAKDDQPAETKDFTIPDRTVLASASHLLIYCSSKLRTPYHTGFKLPGSGARLCLIDRSDLEVDAVDYPDQETDISYARYGDGIGSFSYNPYPDPGSPNLDNGGVEPNFTLQTLDPSTVTPGGDILFRAKASDDVGIVNVSIIYRRLDIQGSEPVIVPLFDDGTHDDGDRLDGKFAGTLSGLPDGAQIEFFVVAVDLTDQSEVLPESATFSAPGRPIRNYTLAVGSAATDLAPGLEISEVIAVNTRGIADESGTLEDWIELRNTSRQPVDLTGLELVQDLFRSSEHYQFPDNTVLAPGEYLIVWADNARNDGPFHAPFRMDASGDETFLVGKTDLGAAGIISAAISPRLEADRTYARITPGGPFVITSPTPGQQNLTNEILPVYFPAEGSFAAGVEVIFRTTAGTNHAIQVSRDLVNWTTATTIEGDGVERSVKVPIAGQNQYIRVKQL